MILSVIRMYRMDARLGGCVDRWVAEGIKRNGNADVNTFCDELIN